MVHIVNMAQKLMVLSIGKMKISDRNDHNEVDFKTFFSIHIKMEPVFNNVFLAKPLYKDCY